MKILYILRISLLTLLTLAWYTTAGYSYQLHVLSNSLVLSAAPGDTAMGYVVVSDGRDSSARPLGWASLYVYGNNDCQIACSRIIRFAGSYYIPIVYTARSNGSQGNLTISSDSGSVSVTLIGKPSGNIGNIECSRPTSPPFFDSIKLTIPLCMNFQFMNYAGGTSDTTVILNIWTDAGNQSGHSFSLEGLPSFPAALRWGSTLNFQVCASATDASDSNYLLGTLHVAYRTKTGIDSELWPLFGIIIGRDSTCLSFYGNMGAVAEGDSILHTLPLYNYTGSSVTIDSARFIAGNTGQFRYIAPAFPFTIPAHSVDSITLEYSVPSPSLAKSYSSTLEMWPSGTSRDSVPCAEYLATVTGQATILPCLKFSASQPLTLPEGTSQVGYDTIVNNADSLVIIDSITVLGADTTELSLQMPTFPASVAPHSTLLLGYRFTVPSPCFRTYFGLNFTIWDHGTQPDGLPCTSLSGWNNGQLLIPWDTITLDVPATALDSVTLNVHAAITGHYIVVHNTASKLVYLENVLIADSSSYASFPYSEGPHCRQPNFSAKSFCFDDSLQAGQWSDTAKLMLQVPDTGTYPLDLQAIYVDALDTGRYAIRIHYVAPPNEAVSPEATAPSLEFSLNPNPAQGNVLISVPDGIYSEVEIYDMVGHLILRKQTNGPFIWNGTSAGGTIMPDGAYIVRVREKTSTGPLRTASKRLMYMH